MRMLFFELLQVALGQREMLCRIPSDKEWAELFETSLKQAVAGIAFAAIDKLSAQGQKLSTDLLYDWIVASEQIRQGNKRLDKCCKQLQRKLNEAGLASSVLKGQGVATYYDVNLRELRQVGDIDIYVDGGREKALAWAKKEGITVRSWDYKHAHLDIWQDVTVEMHYRVEVMLNLWKNRALQIWFKTHKEELLGQDTKKLKNRELENSVILNTYGTNQTDGFVTPTVEFNAFYILLHIYRHFLYEGVGFRQIVDYYFTLKTIAGKNKENTTDSAKEAVRRFGMEKFAKGLMWVMQESLRMPREWMPWEPDKKEGEYILEQVNAGGNFGRYDQRLQHGGGKWNTVKAVCRHNLHIMSHYPSDVVWAPAWFVWHKCWKLTHSL